MFKYFKNIISSLIIYNNFKNLTVCKIIIKENGVFAMKTIDDNALHKSRVIEEKYQC